MSLQLLSFDFRRSFRRLGALLSLFMKRYQNIEITEGWKTHTDFLHLFNNTTGDIGRDSFICCSTRLSHIPLKPINMNMSSEPRGRSAQARDRLPFDDAVSVSHSSSASSGHARSRVRLASVTRCAGARHVIECWVHAHGAAFKRRGNE